MAAVTLNNNAFVTTAPKADAGNTNLNLGVTTTQIPDGYTTVEIDTILVEDTSVKEPMILPIPIPPKDQPRQGGSSTPTTWLIDLLRVKQSITVTGYISDDGTISSFAKKTNLKTIFKYGGTFTVVWGTGSTQEKFTVNTTKYQFKISPLAYVDSGNVPATTPKKGYDVMLQFIVGTDRGG